jgi:hypothetical protein
MIHGISGAPIPSHLPYSSQIQRACESRNFPPCLAYGISWRESISGEESGSWNACTVIAPDFGYGLFQLTYPFCQPWPPNNWQDAQTNAEMALDHFLLPGMKYFVECGVSGDTLVQCIAAGFNCGNEAAWLNHLAGNVDLGTTGQNYASSVLQNFHRLIAGQDPQ